MRTPSDTRDHALAIGARRAEEVRDYLVLLGVPAAQLNAMSWGKERPGPPRGGDNIGALTYAARRWEGGHGKPRSRLPLRFGDFAPGHLERDLGAAFLTAGAARQGSKIEPFVRFDEIDRDAPASGRKAYSKLE